jgi:hypothetical protein
MRKSFAAAALLGLLACSGSWGQQAGAAVSPAPTTRPPGPFALGISGSLYVPLADAAHSFKLGAGEDVSVAYQVPGTVIVVLGGIGYAVAVEQFTAPTVVFAAAELGCGGRFPINSLLEVFAYGTAGYWYGAYWDGSVPSANPCLGAGAELQLVLSPTFALSLGAQYKFYFGLWQGIVTGIGMRIGFESR